MENKSNTSSKLLLRTDFICSSETDSLVLSLILRAAILNIYNNKFAIVVIKALNLVISNGSFARKFDIKQVDNGKEKKKAQKKIA